MAQLEHYDYLLVGAGLFNAVFACEMKKQGKTCFVVEKRSHLAGNIYTSEKRGIHVHEYGAHIFHTSNEEVWEYVNQFARFNHYINSPVAIYREELYNLPFNMNTFSKLWKIKSPAQAQEIIRLQIEKLQIENPANLEEQALSLVGSDVYEKLIKGYTEKQWGKSCRELPAFIIKRIPLRFTYDNNYFNDPYQGIPIGGYTAMVEKMFQDTPILFQTSYRQFVEEQKAHEEAGRERITYDKLIYTGMIDEFFEYCYGPLEYRSLRFETVDMPEWDNYQGNAVLNYTEKDIPYTRSIEHKHFEFGKGEGTIITKEYPVPWEQGMEPYYPINNEKNDGLYLKYRELAAGHPEVVFGGRLGQYRYYDMDKVVEQALLTVKNESN